MHVDAGKRLERVDFMKSQSGAPAVSYYYLHDQGLQYINSADAGCFLLHWPFRMYASPVPMDQAAYSGNVTLSSGEVVDGFSVPILGEQATTDYLQSRSTGLPAGLGLSGNGAVQIRFSNFVAAPPQASVFHLPAACQSPAQRVGGGDVVYGDGGFAFSARPAWDLDAVFRPHNYGLQTGDGGQTTLLPDGAVAVNFDDLNIGFLLVNQRVGQRFLHNGVGWLPSAASVANGSATVDDMQLFVRSQDGQLAAFYSPPQAGDSFWADAGSRLPSSDSMVGVATLLRSDNKKSEAALLVVHNLTLPPLQWRYNSSLLTAVPDFWSGSTAGHSFHDGWLYFLGSKSAGFFAGQHYYVARMSADAALAGDVSALRYWATADDGLGASWRPASSSMKLITLFTSHSSCSSLDWNEHMRAFYTITYDGSGSFGIATAKQITGPWTKVDHLYSVPPALDTGFAIYCAVSHPSFAANDSELVVSYYTNSFSSAWRTKISPNDYTARFFRISVTPYTSASALQVAVAIIMPLTIVGLLLLSRQDRKRREAERQQEGVEIPDATHAAEAPAYSPPSDAGV
eukprot:PLAT6023.1.p1 GENE.PLAT6023.1~~PLAT6023.1.p1  ORF type:complete len:626 (-),score=266.37 PLAT6023.1:36-1745(-)